MFYILEVKNLFGRQIAGISKSYIIIPISDSLSSFPDSGTARDAQSSRCGTSSTGYCSRVVPAWN